MADYLIIGMPEPPSYRVAITANRLLTPDDHGIIFDEMMRLMTDGRIESIYFGGAVGGDTVALKACLDVTIMDRPQLIVVVPNRLADQPKITHEISKKADTLVELANPITVSDGWRSYHIRNEYMVDHAERVVAFWNKSTKPSGTAACIRYALKNKKPVDIIKIAGEDK